MKVTFKLYATLQQYLPAGAHRNQVELEIAQGTTPAELIAQYSLPEKLTHLVLVNGAYVAPEQRSDRALNEGDVLAIWPPIAGG